jgi:hypothetical protein
MTNEESDEEFDSPFAHVPAANAGPLPMKDGPFVWENVAASAGAVSAGRPPRWVYLALGVLAPGVAALVAGAIIGV